MQREKGKSCTLRCALVKKNTHPKFGPVGALGELKTSGHASAGEAALFLAVSVPYPEKNFPDVKENEEVKLLRHDG